MQLNDWLLNLGIHMLTIKGLDISKTVQLTYHQGILNEHLKLTVIKQQNKMHNAPVIPITSHSVLFQQQNRWENILIK